MLSVRIFVTDYASDAIGRLAWLTGVDAWAVFGRVCHLMAQVAHHRPNGVLDGVTPAQLATWSGWTGPASVWADALLESGITCRPSMDPHHHKRCPAKPADVQGQPKRPYPPAELCIHQWDWRMGRLFRQYVKDSRPGLQKVLLRPPPRGARVWTETAPRDNGTPPEGKRRSAPRGANAKTAAPRGVDENIPRGASPASGTDGPETGEPGGVPLGAGGGKPGSAPRGGRGYSDAAKGPKRGAPRDAKRRPKSPRRPGERETESLSSLSTGRGDGAAAGLEPAAGGADAPASVHPQWTHRWTVPAPRDRTQRRKCQECQAQWEFIAGKDRYVTREGRLQVLPELRLMPPCDGGPSPASGTAPQGEGGQG